MKIRRSFNIHTRAIAFVILLAFILQDIVYADPDLLLKSSTLAQKTLITSDDKVESFKRLAVANMDAAVAKDPGMGTVLSASARLREVAAAMGLTGNNLPAISGTAAEGFIKIKFVDGTELVFYNPELARRNNDFGGGVLNVAGKRATPDKAFGRYLWERILLPADKAPRGRVRGKSYEKLLKELIDADDKTLSEVRKALHMVYGDKSKLGVVNKLSSAMSILISEEKMGVVTDTCLRLIGRVVHEIMTMEKFRWVTKSGRSATARQKQLNALDHHIRKAVTFRLRAQKILDDMSGDGWRNYLLSPAASDLDQEAYFKNNLRDILIRLARVIDELPEEQTGLDARLRELCGKLATSKHLNRDGRGDGLYSISRAFQAISKGENLRNNTAQSLIYLAVRCRTLADMTGYVEPPVVISPPEPAAAKVGPRPDGPRKVATEQLELGLDLADKYPGMRGRVNLGTLISLVVIVSFFTAWKAGIDIRDILLFLGALGLTYLLVGRFAQEKYLDYYLKNVSKFLLKVNDGEVYEEYKIRRIYEEVFNVYNLFLIRDMTKKRKKLISEMILANIISPEEAERNKTAKPGEKVIQSCMRSDIAADFVLKRIFASRDPMIFRPALEAVIEIIAKYPKFFQKRLIPLLEESEKLPRFARALVDVLIRAENNDVKLFDMEDRLAFISQGKDIVVELAERSPKLKNEVISYLLEVSDRSEEEAELIHDMLDRIGFIITPSEEFPRTAATQIVETISKIRLERSRSQDPRKTINIVLTGGDTMPGFLEYLASITDKDTLRNVHIYQLCEYEGFAQEDGFSIANFIDRHIPQLIPKENRHYINGTGPDREYMQKLEKAGGADITVLGIGPNGRIGLIEPEDVFDGMSGSLARTRLNGTSPHFTGPTVARTGYTMRMADILSCRNIFLLAKGDAKAEIVKRALFGEVTSRIPASALQRTRHVRVILDMGIMDRLSPKYRKRYKRSIARKLTELEMRSRDLFDDSPTPQHEMDRDCIILRSNMAEARMLGYDSPADIIGRHITDFIHPDDVEGARIRIAEKFKTTQGRLNKARARYITKDRRVIYVDIRDHRIISADGKTVVGMQSTLNDVTDLVEEIEGLKKGVVPQSIQGPASSPVSAREDIENNARLIASHLVNVLLAQDAAHKNEKIVLALDGKLGHTEEIRALVNKYVVEALTSAGAGNEDLKKVFANLVLIDGEAGLLSKRLVSIIDSSRGERKEGLKKENIVIITADSDKEHFKDFESVSFITSVDDSALKAAEAGDGQLGYYPMLELVFFSVARMVVSSQGSIEGNRNSLWKWYKSIPNIEDLDMGRFESMVYEPDGTLKRTILLKLIPRVKRFDKDELRNIYERIREFITKA